MGLNRNFDRGMFVIGGAVKTAGNASQLTKGELALVNITDTAPGHVPALSTTAGASKKEKKFQLRVGINEKPVTRSRNNHSQRTMPFSLNDVVDLRVSAPQRTKQGIDDLVIGYDGFDPNTAFKFNTGDSYFRISLELSGGVLEYRGGHGYKEMVNVNVEVPDCDPFDTCGPECDECSTVDCRKVVKEAIERLRRKELTGGMLVEEVVDITPVFSCNEAVSETPYDYYELEVCDTGTDEALALVEAQYDVPVIAIDRKGSVTTYQILIPQSAGAPDNYEQSIASIIKGCEDCPAGWSEAGGGYVYTMSVEDNGNDVSTEIDTAFTNQSATSTTITKEGNSAGVGFYVVLSDADLTETEKAAVITELEGLGTPLVATIEYLGESDAICENDTVTEISWTQTDTCNVTQESYDIILPDTECGETRLDELNGAYTDLTITVGTTTGTGVDITLTDSGSASNGDSLDITIDGTSYTATFDTDLATTASNFVSTHAADIYANHNIVVTAPGGAVIHFESVDTYWVEPTVGNQSGIEFSATVGTVNTDTEVEHRQGCQTKYTTTVTSNIVCEECDDVFKDFYVTEAPDKYEEITWTPSDPSTYTNSDCLCGIRVRGKEFILDAEEALVNRVGYTETSTKVRAAAAYPEEIREGIGRLPKGTASVKYFDRAVARTHVGGNLRPYEDESRAYFQGVHRPKDYLEKILMGAVSNMEDQSKQYVQYTLVVDHHNKTQGFGSRKIEGINYDVFVEVGRHKAVEDLLNDIAANAGVETVTAFGA